MSISTIFPPAIVKPITENRRPSERRRHEARVAVHENELIGQADLRERRGLCGDGLAPSHDAVTGPRAHRHRPAARYPDRARRPDLRSRRRGRPPETHRRRAAAVASRGLRPGPALDAAPRAARELSAPHGERSTIGAISSNVMPNTSCSTKARRSAGSRSPAPRAARGRPSRRASHRTPDPRRRG